MKKPLLLFIVALLIPISALAQSNPCIESGRTTNACHASSASFVSLAFSPAFTNSNFSGLVCLSNTISASFVITNSPGSNNVTITYTNAAGDGCSPSNVPSGPINPIYVSTNYTISGAITASGTPPISVLATNLGTATLTVTLQYSNAPGGDTCISELATTTISANFAVFGLTGLDLGANVGQRVDNVDADDTNVVKTYIVQWDCLNTFYPVTATVSPSISEAELPSCWSMTGGYIGQNSLGRLALVDFMLPPHGAPPMDVPRAWYKPVLGIRTRALPDLLPAKETISQLARISGEHLFGRCVGPFKQ